MGSYQSKHTGSQIDAGIDAANAALPRSGGTMTGTLILNRNPVSNYEASTKQYVDQSIAGISNSSGGNGKDGVGIKSITKTGTSGLVDTYTITLTDDSKYTFTVTNGKDGSGEGGSGKVYMQANGGYIQFSNDGLSWQNVIALSELKGENGSDGAAGFSPTVNVTKITGGHRVTITDANGAKTFDVMDGANGSGGSGGSGDMLKSVYDADNDGVVDDAKNASTLDGHSPNYFATADHTHDYVTSVNGESGDVIIGIPTPSSIVDLIYPVGSIYMSASATNPTALFGGSWTQIKDSFLLSAGSTYSNGETGGAATHKHIAPIGYEASSKYFGTLNINGTTTSFSSVGGYNTVERDAGGTDIPSGIGAYYTQTVSNMPPYLVVYVWKRIA